MQSRRMLQLNITEECSNRCLYCVFSGHYNHERKHSSRHMDIEIAKTAICDFLDNATVSETPHLSFYGGEALMPDAVELVRECVGFARKRAGDKGITFGLTTNGRHFTESTIRFLVENNFMLMVSLDGPKQIHNRYRRSSEGNGTFDEVIAGLESIEKFSQEYYTRIGFICVLTPPLDISAVRDFFNADRHVRGHNMLFSFVNLFDHSLPIKFDETEFAAESARMYREAISRYYECALDGTMDDCGFERALLNKNLGLLRMSQQESGTGIIGPNGCCVPGARRCFVNTDGQLYACEKVAGFKPIGNVQSNICPEKVNEMLTDFRELSSADCCACWCGNICDLCFYSARKDAAFFGERKAVACQERRSFFKALIRLYASLHESGGEDLLKRVIPSVIG